VLVYPCTDPLGWLDASTAGFWRTEARDPAAQSLGRAAAWLRAGVAFVRYIYKYIYIYIYIHIHIYVHIYIYPHHALM